MQSRTSFANLLPIAAIAVDFTCPASVAAASRASTLNPAGVAAAAGEVPLYADCIVLRSVNTSSLFDAKYALASLPAVENEQLGGAGVLASDASVGAEMPRLSSWLQLTTRASTPAAATLGMMRAFMGTLRS